MKDTRKLIAALQNPDLYNHPVHYFKVIETHVSFVILTGEFAYKIKKPVDFVFLDYSTLEKRKHFCNLEWEFNQPLAKEIYLEVLPIYGSVEEPSFKSGEIIEYALKSREFSQQDLFSSLAKENKITKDYILILAELIANFHHEITSDIESYLGTSQQVHEPVIQNFDQVIPLESDTNILKQLETLKIFADQEWSRWHEVMNARKKTGFVKPCHGDIHLGNITLFNQKPLIFDCIEFSEAIRVTDVMADVAFLYMDLVDQNLISYANILLNRYLQLTNDYQGLAIFPYYLNYRAMVRAKINLFQSIHAHDAEEKASTFNNYQRYLNLASRFTQKHQPKVILLHGLSGSGKSTVANDLVEQFGFIQLSSDYARKKLAGVDEHAQLNQSWLNGYYHPDFTIKIYEYLLATLNICVDAGYSVVVDATFGLKQQRELFLSYLQEQNIDWRFVHCVADDDISEKYLVARKTANDQISEAGTDIRKMQQQTFEALTAAENQFVLENLNYDSSQVLKWVSE